MSQANRKIESPSTNKAVIYNRVSTVRQFKEGDGLGSQELRCREYAALKGYKVLEVFQDTRTGKVVDRPAMKELLKYLRQHKAEGRIVIIDHIDRFARNALTHMQLRAELAKAGGKLESPSMEFGDSADARLVENLLAVVSGHQAERIRETAQSRMESRVKGGYWPFGACWGYRHETKEGKGKLLVRDEPLASIIQEGLEGFASGRYASQAEVMRFFQSHSEFPRGKKVGVTNQRVNNILTRVLYAGYVEHPGWGISRRKGEHTGLISLATFERIQQRLNGEEIRRPIRAGNDMTFPLRGSVSCAACGGRLTSCFSTSKTGKPHPYYMCFTRGCTRNRKSIRQEKIEGEFVELLARMTPNADLVGISKAMFKEIWNQRTAQAESLANACRREIAKIETQIGAFLDRIVQTESKSIIGRYEEQVITLERSKLLLEEKQQLKAQLGRTFDDLFELALKFLENPHKLWKYGDFLWKKLVLRLAFAEDLLYCAQTGFRTPETSLPFKLLCDGNLASRRLAEPEAAKPSSRFLHENSYLIDVIDTFLAGCDDPRATKRATFRPTHPGGWHDRLSDPPRWLLALRAARSSRVWQA